MKLIIEGQMAEVVRTKESSHGFVEVFVDSPEQKGVAVMRILLPKGFLESDSYPLINAVGTEVKGSLNTFQRVKTLLTSGLRVSTVRA
jgi:hypothetical protein